MDKNTKFFLGVVLFIFLFAKNILARDLKWECLSRDIRNVNEILVEDDARIIYLGTDKGIFKTINRGASWQISLLVKGENKKVNFLLKAGREKIYAATGNGLYLTYNQGKSWRRVFRGKSKDENECNTLLILPNGYSYLGTSNGLFISKDGTKNWHKASGKLKNRAVISIAFDRIKRIIYLTTSYEVFKIGINNPDFYEKIFIAKAAKYYQEETENGVTENGLINNYAIKYIAVDSRQQSNIYLATNSGIYKSNDEGQSWDLMPASGLLRKEVKSLNIPKTSFLYAVTDSGIFLFKGGKWQELSLGLPVLAINSLAIEDGVIYAATENGLFKSAQSSAVKVNEQIGLHSYFKGEPSIRQVYQAAIKYAQVIDPRRIEKHRRGARLKAILPDFSLDYDKTVSTYSNSSATRFTVGPCDWGVSLKWNLGDLIWSEQQRLIDSQVRLMVQLRNEILDEVNKLYFERIRLKMEIISGNFDTFVKMEKELKIEELTASLDALTGGYFSKFIRDRSI